MSNGHLVLCPMDPIDMENVQWTFEEVLDMYERLLAMLYYGSLFCSHNRHGF